MQLCKYNNKGINFLRMDIPKNASFADAVH